MMTHHWPGNRHPLIYGAMASIMAALVWIGPSRNDCGLLPPKHVHEMMAIAIDTEAPTTLQLSSSLSHWEQAIPALKQPLEMHLTNVPLSEAVGVIAANTKINLVCWDSEHSTRLSLQMQNVPVWQVMAVIERVTGSIWERDHSVYTLRHFPKSQVRQRLSVAQPVKASAMPTD